MDRKKRSKYSANKMDRLYAFHQPPIHSSFFISYDCSYYQMDKRIISIDILSNYFLQNFF